MYKTGIARLFACMPCGMNAFKTKYHNALAFTIRYLVDPASSHMLVLKIKPCMSKYKHVVL